MAGELLLVFAAHFALTALPAAAAALLAARLGVRSVPVLLAVALAATGALAMLAFWAYYGSRTLGESVTYLTLFGSILAIVWSLWEGRIERDLLRALATPLVLWGLGSLFLLYLGFAHEGASNALGTAATRFSGQLPSDNDIPRFYAEWFYLHGHHGTPPEFPGEWFVSDRPPLQIGYVLAQRPFGWGEEPPHYETLCLLLQQMWIVGLWALLLAARVGRLTRALAMLTVLVSDVAIVNGFFVWPKMLPTAMLLGAAALVATPLWSELRRDPRVGLLVGTLFGLALLAHGGSAFGVIPLAVLAAFRGLPSWRWLGAALLAGIVLMVPWSAFQKYDSPPGDRVTKWMLAGVPDVDERGLGETLADSYSEEGIGGTLDNKLDNLETMVGLEQTVDGIDHAFDALDEGKPGIALAEVRSILFFYLLPSLGLLLIAPLAMLARRWRRGPPAVPEWGFALTCFAIVAIGALAWALILFGNEWAHTVLHQGSFLLPVLGLVGAVCGLRAAYPRFATWYVLVAAALMLAIYVPSLTPPLGTSYSWKAIALAAAGLAGFAAVVLRGPSDDAPAAASPPAAAR
jgi:hypothetical protein